MGSTVAPVRTLGPVPVSAGPLRTRSARFLAREGDKHVPILVGTLSAVRPVVLREIVLRS